MAASLRGWSWGTGVDPTAGGGREQAVTFRAQLAHSLPWALGQASEVMITLWFRRALPVAQTSDTEQLFEVVGCWLPRREAGVVLGAPATDCHV